jgi:hypothetical protein
MMRNAEIRALRPAYPALLLLAASVLAGCSMARVESSGEQVDLTRAAVEVPEARLLDVGVIEFAPGIEEDNEPEKSGIYPEIRRAEARYFAYHLKNTLQRTGYWGAVRVLPSRDVYTDLYLTGEILESDGDTAELEVVAFDATGREWMERRYKTRMGAADYSRNRDRRNDPYQSIYNEIANDLKKLLDELSAEEVGRIRTVAELRFMEDLAPRVYDDYVVETDRGRYEILRLPAENDPMLRRLRQVRERDNLFVDTLNEHYANFYYGIAIPYEGWRKAARERAVTYREMRRSAIMRGLAGVAVVAGAVAADTDSSSGTARRTKRALQSFAIHGGLEMIGSAFRRNAEARLHKESIRELADSFSSEAAPMVVTVKGQTRRLTGTAEAQYEQWRRLLHEIYEAETGLPEELQVGPPSRAVTPTG